MNQVSKSNDVVGFWSYFNQGWWIRFNVLCSYCLGATFGVRLALRRPHDSWITLSLTEWAIWFQVVLTVVIIRAAWMVYKNRQSK